MKKYVYLLVMIFAVACLVRFYPALISGLPFSTDGWSSIRNAELILQFTPVSLSDASVFDGYNNYWPANSIFGAVLSQVTGFAPVDVMAFGVPLAGALTIPLFFVLVRKVTERVEIALLSSALLATAYPYALFTAGVTKETFANPIYLSLILIFLLRPSFGKILLFSIASVALVLSHHLTAFITVGIFASLTVGLFYSKKSKIGCSVRSNGFLLFIFSLILAVYFGFYAFHGLTFTLVSSDFLTIGAYQLLVLALVLFFASKLNFSSRKIMMFSFVVTLVSAILLALLITVKPLVAGAPVLPFHYLLYASPYLVLLPLMTLGFGGLHKRSSVLLMPVPVFWLAPLVGFECYAVFGASPMGLTLVYRLLNFLLLPLCVLFGVAFYKLYVFFKGKRGCRVLGVGVIALVIAVAGVNCFSVFASVSLKEPYMGYFWLYRTPEGSASNWVSVHMVNGFVAGDAKVAYFLKGYFNLNVDVPSGLRFLSEGGSAPKLLYVYPEMSTNGYVIYGGYPLALPDDWTERLSGLNSVYSNNMVCLYAS